MASEARRRHENCASCGADLDDAGVDIRAKYCSEKCKYTADNLKRDRSKNRCCKECGADMFGQRNHSIYCGKDCRKAAANRARLKRNAKRREESGAASRRPPRAKCRYCGQDLKTAVSAKRVYCGDICKDRGRALDRAEVAFKAEFLDPPITKSPGAWGYATPEAHANASKHKSTRMEAIVVV